MEEDKNGASSRRQDMAWEGRGIDGSNQKRSRAAAGQGFTATCPTVAASGNSPAVWHRAFPHPNNSQDQIGRAAVVAAEMTPCDHKGRHPV